MATHGQFCAVARALDVLGGRWTLLVVRELMCGGRRFNEIRRGIPRISRTTLSERMQALMHIGAVERTDGPHGPEYSLTPTGLELSGVVEALGVWGQKCLPRNALDEGLDLDPLLLDMQRRVRPARLPGDPLVVRFELDGCQPRLMLLRQDETGVCTRNPGFPEPLCVRGPVGALAAWWRGDLGFIEARRIGLAIEGPKELVRAFPEWFDRYLFAQVSPAARSQPAEVQF